MARVEWYDNESEMYKKMVRGIEGIGAATAAEAAGIMGRAVAKLTPHNINHDSYRRPGEPRSFITMNRGGGNGNAYVVLEDPKGRALAIEGTLNIIRSAAVG